MKTELEVSREMIEVYKKLVGTQQKEIDMLRSNYQELADTALIDNRRLLAKLNQLTGLTT